MTALASPQSTSARASARSLCIGALVASVFVATGAAISAVVTPPVLTPENVARGYVHARFAHDWRTLWDLSCRSTQARSGDYQTFVSNLVAITARDIPMDVDVAVGAVRRAPVTTFGARSVALEVTSTNHDASSRDWRQEEVLLLVEEDGGLRVCR